MRQEYSADWKSSTQTRKQRKYRYNAPTHIKHRFMSALLSKELRKTSKRRNIPIRKGDKVKVLRGNHKGKSGEISTVDRAKERVYIEGITRTKIDGNTSPISFHPSNLMITTLKEDKKRRAS